MKEDTQQSSAKGMSGIIASVVPTIVWASIALFVICEFRVPIASFLERTTSFKWGDIELNIEKSTRQFPMDTRPEVNTPSAKRLARRMEKIPVRAAPYRILVAHDELLAAKYLQKGLAELGFVADVGICSGEVEEMLRRHLYDAVLSDIDWSRCSSTGEEKNGVTFLSYAKEQEINRPTIFFVANHDRSRGTPAYATGITDDWYEAINFILDAIDRENSP